MTISSKDLEKVCNYKESIKPSLPQIQMTYLEMFDTYNDEYQRHLKMKNRGLAIDALLDEEKTEEYKNRDYSHPLDNEGDYIHTITPQLMSVNVQGKNYLDLSDIYVDVMNTLNYLTMNPMKVPQNLNIKFSKSSNLSDYENKETFTRKIITKIQLCSSMISMSSRKGPAHSIIVGLDVYPYLLIQGYLNMKTDGICIGTLNNMNVIPSNLIDSKKVIIMRCEKQTETGLNVINCPNDMRYFIKETTNTWSKNIHWFEIS